MGNVVKKSQPPPPYGNGGKPYRVSDIIEEKKKKKLRILEDEYIKFRIIVKTKTTDEEIYNLLQQCKTRSKYLTVAQRYDLVFWEKEKVQNFVNRYNKEECPSFKLSIRNNWYDHDYDLMAKINKNSILMVDEKTLPIC